MPFLNDNFIDTISGKLHCPTCQWPVCTRDGAIKDHISSEWRHFAWTHYKPVLGVDERGMTSQHLVAVPGRTVLALIPIATNVRYCLDHHPFKYDIGCAGCGEPVNLKDEHSEVSTLVCLANGINHDFTQRVFHIDCLPEGHFDAVKETRNLRKASLP